MGTVSKPEGLLLWVAVVLVLLCCAGSAAMAADATTLVLDNGVLEVRYSVSKGAMQVTDKRIGHTYTQAGYPANEGEVLPAPDGTISVTRKLGGLSKPTNIKIAFAPGHPEEVTLEISGDPETRVSGNVPFPLRFVSTAGEFLLIPRGEGYIWPVEDKTFWGSHVDLFWTGCLQDMSRGSGVQIIYDTPFDVFTEVSLYKGLMSLAPQWQASKGKLGYTRRLTYRFYDSGGYVAMAKDYKLHTAALGYQKTLVQKAKERPAVKRLVGAVDMWPMSRDVATPEFFRNLKLLGVDRVIASLGGGWLAPSGVEELIDLINSKGFLSSRYDIYTFVWDPASTPSEDFCTVGFPTDMIRDAKGNMQVGWVAISGEDKYPSYYACAMTHAAVATDRIGSELPTQHYNSRFIDCVTATNLQECYDPLHPTTREQDAKARAEMLGLVSGRFGLVTGSEQSQEWAMGVTDFGEGTMSIRFDENAGYDWMTPVKATPVYLKENADGSYRIPLVSLTYHDAHISTWYTGDGLAKVPEAWAPKELLNILYGSMPLWLFDGPLWEERKVDFIRSYQNVNVIFKQVGYDEMVDHRFLTPDRNVQRTSFSGGTSVLGNFGDAPWPLDLSAQVGSQPGTLAALGLPGLAGLQLSVNKNGFAASGPGLFSFRGTAAGTDGIARPLNVVRAKDRLFLDPSGSIWDVGALASKAMVLLHSDGELASAKQCRLVVLGGAGDTTEVTIRPELLGPAWVAGLAKVAQLDLDLEGRPLAAVPVKRVNGAYVLSVPTSRQEFTVCDITAE